jgi:hypothetical protein
MKKERYSTLFSSYRTEMRNMHIRIVNMNMTFMAVSSYKENVVAIVL